VRGYKVLIDNLFKTASPKKELGDARSEAEKGRKAEQKCERRREEHFAEGPW